MTASPPTIPELFSASISDKAFAPGCALRENLRRIRAAGFTHVHLAHKWTVPEPFTAAEEEEWTQALAAEDVRVLDVHGCNPKGINLWSETGAEKQQAMDLFVHRLELTHRMGGNAMVYHVPWKEEVTQKQIEDLLEALRRVEVHARRLGIAIALENHYRAENDRRTLSAAFEVFDADFVGFTFDPGHALISGNTEWLLRNCASRLQVLHLNDNDTKEDQHWCPFDSAGKADWPAIQRFLAGSVYRKPLQLEVRWDSSHHNTHEAFLAEAFRAAKRLAATPEAEVRGGL